MNTCRLRSPVFRAGCTLVTSLLLCSAAGTALLARNSIPAHTQPLLVDSGRHDGTSNGTAVAFQEVVRVPGAPWLRLHISEGQLGRQSWVVLTSLMDGGQQKLDATSLPQWGNWSAYFNGEAVRVELHVAQGDDGVFLRISEVTVGESNAEVPAFAAAASPCSDPRVPSTDGRVGRIVNTLGGGGIVFCTAWLASNGSLVTAGHCADNDPDGAGPVLPDGVLDFTSSAMVEFNVPSSSPSGAPRFAAPIDQYPIILSSVRWEFPGFAVSLVGGDWAVFACGANSTTRLTPHQAQGAFFRVTNQSPFPGLETVSVRGYGTDSTPPGTGGGENSSTLTLQTSKAGYLGEFNVLPAPWPIPLPVGNYHSYTLNSEGGSSGAPIIWDNTGFVIGINVAGSCNSGAGTSTENDPLELALQNFPGTNTRYVDAFLYPQLAIPIKNGSIFYPFDKVGDAVNAVPAGANISIVAGHYNEALTLSKRVTLTAPVGGVTIGQ